MRRLSSSKPKLNHFPTAPTLMAATNRHQLPPAKSAMARKYSAARIQTYPKSPPINSRSASLYLSCIVCPLLNLSLSDIGHIDYGIHLLIAPFNSVLPQAEVPAILMRACVPSGGSDARSSGEQLRS